MEEVDSKIVDLLHAALLPPLKNANTAIGLEAQSIQQTLGGTVPRTQLGLDRTITALYVQHAIQMYSKLFLALMDNVGISELRGVMQDLHAVIESVNSNLGKYIVGLSEGEVKALEPLYSVRDILGKRIEVAVANAKLDSASKVYAQALEQANSGQEIFVLPDGSGVMMRERGALDLTKPPVEVS